MQPEADLSFFFENPLAFISRTTTMNEHSCITAECRCRSVYSLGYSLAKSYAGPGSETTLSLAKAAAAAAAASKQATDAGVQVEGE